MKFEQLIEATGITIVEGGPFMFDDFGPSWVLLFEDELTTTIINETKEVVFVECTDCETRTDVYMWMNPKYSEYEKKVYDELDGAVTHRCEDIEEVFAVWHKNKELVAQSPEDFGDSELEWQGLDSETKIH